jgi:hypothetical protein
MPSAVSEFHLLKLVILLHLIMPYTTQPATTAYDPSQQLPQHLDHRPVFALPYDAFDGPSAGHSDVQFLTVGMAQWNADEVSIKTMRHTGTKWTRQAEELPLHRPIDMTLFMAKVIFDSTASVVNIPSGTLQKQASDILITPEQRSYGEMASYNAAVNQNQPVLKERLNALREVLNDLKARGKI